MIAPKSHWILSFKGSGLAQSRRLTSARSELVRGYVLIPVIFILRSHTASSGSLLVMLQLFIPVNCRKRSCSHMISLRQFTGNFLVKSVCVKGAIVKIVHKIKVRIWTTDVTWTILSMSLLPFWTLSMVVVLLSMQVRKLSDERGSYRFGTIWGWVINKKNFGWTIPLKNTVTWSLRGGGVFLVT